MFDGECLLVRCSASSGSSGGLWGGLGGLWVAPGDTLGGLWGDRHGGLHNWWGLVFAPSNTLALVR